MFTNILFIIFVCLVGFYFLIPCVITNDLEDFFMMSAYQRKYLKGNIIGFEKSDRQYEVIDKRTKEKIYLDLYHPIVSFTIYGEERIEKSYSVTVKYIYDMFEYDIKENLDKIELESPISVCIRYRLNGERIMGVRKWDEWQEKRQLTKEEKELDRIKKYFQKYGYSKNFINTIDLDTLGYMRNAFSMSWCSVFCINAVFVVLLVFFIWIMYPIAEFIFPYISFLF